MSSPLVSVVIANLNGRSYLERCFETLAAQTYPCFEIIMVDNGSTDGSIQFVTEQFPVVQIIQNDRNLGFAAANNQGIEAASGDYVATLNNDTEVDPSWLTELVRGINLAPDVGMCASKMVFLSDRCTIDSAGLSPDRAGIAWNRLSGEPDVIQMEDAEEVFGPCAGAALYRRKMLNALGGFDEDFFAYLEDVDLAWQARLAGWRCMYIPTAIVYHAHSATTGEASPLKVFLLSRNRIWAIIKNYPSPEVWRFLPLILFYDLVSLAYRFTSGGGWMSLQGRWAALKLLPYMLERRKQVQRAATPIGRANAWQLMLSPSNPFDVLRRVSKLQAHAVKTGQRRQPNDSC